MRHNYRENEKIKVHCTDNIFVCDGEVQIGTGHIVHKRAFEQLKENQSKKKRTTDLEPKDDKFPDDIKKVITKSCEKNSSSLA